MIKDMIAFLMSAKMLGGFISSVQRTMEQDQHKKPLWTPLSLQLQDWLLANNDMIACLNTNNIVYLSNGQRCNYN